MIPLIMNSNTPPGRSDISVTILNANKRTRYTGTTHPRFSKYTNRCNDSTFNNSKTFMEFADLMYEPKQSLEIDGLHDFVVIAFQ